MRRKGAAFLFRATHLSSRTNGDRFYVASQATGAAGLADRYAAALFDLADEAKALDRIADDLRALRSLLAESDDFRRLVRSPVLSRADQGKAVAALGERAGYDRLTRNFLGLLARNRRLFALPEMIRAFLDRLAQRRGEVTAEVVSAAPLTRQQQDTLDERLRRAVGRKVAIETKVDPSLLGGLVVKVGSRMVDASLKSKLQRLQLAMKGVQ
jgi:F-type H+-transporting ATPase subunit delta